MLKVAFISSGKNTTVKRLSDIFKDTSLKINFYIISDRNVKNSFVRSQYLKKNIVKRTKDVEIFCKEVKKILKNIKADFVFLLYTKKITSDIFDNFNTFNIHPSLLPYGKGLLGIEKIFKITKKDGNNFFGSSLHKVNQNYDDGKVLSQIRFKMEKKINLKIFDELNFFSKIIMITNLILSKEKNFSSYDKKILSQNLNNLLEKKGRIKNFKNYKKYLLNQLAI